MKLRQDIQMLRGVAVLLVLLYHLQTPFFENGYLGVDVFFVLSGFLMAKLYDRGTVREFYLRRLDRILPAYAVTVLGTLIVCYYLIVPVDFTQLYNQAIASVFFASNVFFWNQNSYFESADFNPLLNLWSLAVEIQFYLVVPFLYPLIRRYKMLLFVLVGLSLFACLVMQAISPKTAFFMLPFRMWEFVIGAWVAWNVVDKDAQKVSWRYQVLPLALFVVIFFAAPIEPDGRSILSGHPSIFALFIVLGTGAMLYLGLPRKIEVSVLGRFFAKIGDYSYSIYLVHFPIVVLWNYQEFGGTRLSTETGLGVLAIIALVGIASFLSYYIIESRLAVYLKASMPRIGIFAAIVAIASGADALNSAKYTDQQKNIFSAWNDRSAYRCGKVFRILHPMSLVCPLTPITDNKRMLLLGNSHADSIKTSFAAVAERNRVDLYFMVPNEPLMSAQLNAERIIEELENLELDYLVIHFSDIYEKNVFREQLVSLLSQANGEGIKSAILAPVPYYDEHIPKSMYEAEGQKYSFALSSTEHYTKTSFFLDFATVLSALGVAVHDPAEVFCGQGDCAFSDAESRPFYFDSGHLTLTGASQLDPMFAELIHDLQSE